MRTLSGIKVLAIGTPQPDDTSMKDATESDKQTPEISRKRQLYDDSISTESISSYRKGSLEHPARRSKGQRPVSAPYGSNTEEIRRSDGFGGSRPSASRKLWTADQTTASPHGNIDPSNVASIQARKKRVIPSPTGVASPQGTQLPKRSQRPWQDDTSTMRLQPETRPISQEQLVAEARVYMLDL